MKKSILILSLLTLAAGCSAKDTAELGQMEQNRLAPESAESAVHISLTEVFTRTPLLELRGDWAKARALYEQGLSQHPDNARLDRMYQSFRVRFQARMASTAMESMISRAHWLKQQHQYLKLTDANYKGELLNEASELAKDLAAWGKTALEQQQMELAERALSESQKIAPSREVRQIYEAWQDLAERQDLARLVKQGRRMAELARN
jgi:hypothetical protein